MLSKKMASGFLCLVLSLPLVFFLYGAESKLYFSIQKKKKPKDWLDGPVQYIITEEERKLFKKLHTDEEKTQFIEWFWARRDPRKATIRNEFRDEFNRRVNYANAHFREKKIRGWNTARGWVYIVLGPPSKEWKQSIGIGTYGLFWYYDNPLFNYWLNKNVLIFTKRNGRYILGTQRSGIFQLIPAKWLRVFKELNKMAIVKADLKLEDIKGKEVAGDAAEPGEVPFEWKVDFIPAAEEKIRLKLTIAMLYKDISYYQKDNQYYADLNVSVKLFEEADQLAAELKDEISIELTEDELMAKVNENLEYEGSLLADPGEYNIKIILEDMKTHISKTIIEKLKVLSKSE